MNIRNINQNITGQKQNGGKASFINASGPKDIFVKSESAQPEPSLKNLAQTLSAKDAGKVLLGEGKDMEALQNTTVDTPQWEIRGGTCKDSDMVFDKKNNCVYCGIQDMKASGRKKYYLTCLNTDGSVRWKFDKAAFKMGPVQDGDGNIYFSGKHNLFAIDKNGTEKWSMKLDGLEAATEKPLVSPDGTVFVSVPDDNDTDERKIYAVRNGEISWTYKPDQWDKDTHSIMAGKDGSLYIAGRKKVVTKGFFKDKTTVENLLIRLNPDGSEKFRVSVEDWPNTVDGALCQGPDGTVYTLQNNGFVKGYSPEGTEIFSRQITGKGLAPGKGMNPWYPPVIDKFGNMYLFVNRGQSAELIRLDKDGNEIWRKETRDRYTSRPHLLPDGNIAIGMEDEHIHVFDMRGRHKMKFLIGSEERINKANGYGMRDNIKIVDDFAINEVGRIFVSAGNRTLAYDSRIELQEKITGKMEGTETVSLNDGTITLEDENVVIGGVKLKRNRSEDAG